MIKFCFECKTHFHCSAEMHERVYHPHGEWMYRRGSGEPEEQYPDV
jgi:hypothetical protein